MKEVAFFLVGFSSGIVVWEIGHYLAIYIAKRIVRKFMQSLSSSTKERG